MKCNHKRCEYHAEYRDGLLFRDYMKCLTCGAEYSIVEGQWAAAPAPRAPETETPGDPDA